MTLTKSAVLLLSVFTPQLAFAHTSLVGVGSFYNGALHPVVVPAHLLLLIAVGLLFGQREPNENQTTVAVFLTAMIVGLVTAWFAVEGGREVQLLFGAAIISLLIVSSLPIGQWIYWLIAALSGFFLGMDSTQELLWGEEKLVAMIGTGAGITLLLFAVMAFAHYFSRKAWQTIGLRILGSWIAASSLLVLVLSLSTASR